MSIYPVKLNEWFPKKDKMYENSLIVVKLSNCVECGKSGKNIKYRYAIGHHSIPWGNGDIWCTKRCYNKWNKK
jgi:hypothetical protein